MSNNLNWRICWTFDKALTLYGDKQDEVQLDLLIGKMNSLREAIIDTDFDKYLDSAKSIAAKLYDSNHLYTIILEKLEAEYKIMRDVYSYAIPLIDQALEKMFKILSKRIFNYSCLKYL